MNERETKTIETIGGHKVEMKTYITFGESREISNVYLEGANVELDEGGKPKMSSINAGLSSKAQDKAIEMLVVSVDGIKENVVEMIKNLPKTDGDKVMEEMNMVQNPIDAEKKTI